MFRGGSTAGLTPPVAEYSHGTGTRQGSTVIGGYVYRGSIQPLQGLYVFADFITPNVWTMPVSRASVGTTLPSSEFTVRNADFAPNIGSFTNIASFGLDAAGNLYLVDLDGEIFVIEPVLTAAPASSNASRMRLRDVDNFFRTDRNQLPR